MLNSLQIPLITFNPFNSLSTFSCIRASLVIDNGKKTEQQSVVCVYAITTALSSTVTTNYNPLPVLLKYYHRKTNDHGKLYTYFLD